MRVAFATIVAAMAIAAWPGLSAAPIPNPPPKIKDVPPVYPPEALKAGDEGWVFTEVKIDASGAVSDARILRSSCHRLDDAALAAVRQWRWEKFLVNGKPTPWILTVHVPFRLPKALASRAGRPGACRWTEAAEACDGDAWHER